MESYVFVHLKTFLQYALAKKLHWCCCNNAVCLLNKAKILFWSSNEFIQPATTSANCGTLQNYR